MRRLLKVLALAGWTWLGLLPVGAFHHMVRFGVLGWGILDGEAMNDAEGGGLAFRWSLGLLLLSVTAWLGAVLIALRRKAR